MMISLFFAKRYTFSKKKTNAINIISGISAFVIAIVTMALIIILSSVNGLQSLVLSFYTDFDPDIVITPKTGKTMQKDTIPIIEIEQISKVKDMCYIYEENAMIKYKDNQYVCKIKGVTDNFIAMSNMGSAILNGSAFLQQDEKNYGLIGQYIASKIQIRVNDVFNPIQLYAPTKGEKINTLNPEESVNSIYIYASGIFSIQDVDRTFVITTLKAAQTLFNEDSTTFTALELELKTSNDQKNVKKELQKILGKNYIIKTQPEIHAFFLKIVKTEKLATFLIMAFILILAVVNIIGSITMLIIDKKEDIFTLKSMGLNNIEIRKIFLFSGLSISFLGACIGLILGSMVCLLQKHFGLVTYGMGFSESPYPIEIHFADYILVIISVIIISFATTYFPIKKTLK